MEGTVGYKISYAVLFCRDIVSNLPVHKIYLNFCYCRCVSCLDGIRKRFNSFNDNQRRRGPRAGLCQRPAGASAVSFEGNV